MLQRLACILVVLGLASSASALVVDTFMQWTDEIQLADLEPPGLEITSTGHAQFTARVDHDGVDVSIAPGGILETQDTYKLPDDAGPSNVFVDGTWNANNIESFGPNRDSAIVMNDDGVINLATGFGGTGPNERYDPLNWIMEDDGGDLGKGTLKLDPSLDPGVWSIKIEDLGDGASRITVIPEPGTLVLLGIGGLVLVRRRK